MTAVGEPPSATATDPHLIARAVPVQFREEVAEVLDRLVVAFPNDESLRAQAIADVLDALRAL